jgi:hypothetical protein
MCSSENMKFIFTLKSTARDVCLYLRVLVFLVSQNIVHHNSKLATSWKVASSIPDEVNESVNVPNPSGRTRPWGSLSL